MLPGQGDVKETVLSLYHRRVQRKFPEKGAACRGVGTPSLPLPTVCACHGHSASLYPEPRLLPPVWPSRLQWTWWSAPCRQVAHLLVLSCIHLHSTWHTVGAWPGATVRGPAWPPCSWRPKNLPAGSLSGRYVRSLFLFGQTKGQMQKFPPCFWSPFLEITVPRPAHVHTRLPVAQSSSYPSPLALAKAVGGRHSDILISRHPSIMRCRWKVAPSELSCPRRTAGGK